MKRKKTKRKRTRAEEKEIEYMMVDEFIRKTESGEIEPMPIVAHYPQDRLPRKEVTIEELKKLPTEGFGEFKDGKFVVLCIYLDKSLFKDIDDAIQQVAENMIKKIREGKEEKQ